MPLDFVLSGSLGKSGYRGWERGRTVGEIENVGVMEGKNERYDACLIDED